MDDVADDPTLLERGLMAPPPTTPAGGRVMLIACGALARELDALRRVNAWRGVDLEALPATLHNVPERIPELLRIRARAARARGYGRIVAVYGDCGTAGRIAAVCAEEGVACIDAPHCAAMHLGLDRWAERAAAAPAAFYATDFFVRCFDALIWRGMGVGRHPELHEMLFGHHDRFVHLAQTDDPALDAAGREAAARLGLPYERRATGLRGLEAALAPHLGPEARA